MGMKNRAKWLYARKLEEMSKEMPFNKVKIKDLCERCDSSIQNFYYHFHDKYELAAWIYMHDSDEALALNEDYTLENVTKTYDVYWRHRDFYWWVFNDPSKFNVGVSIRQSMVEFETGLLCKATGLERLPIQLVALVHYHSDGMITLLEEWILGTLRMNAEELARFQIAFMPEPLLKLTHPLGLPRVSVHGRHAGHDRRRGRVCLTDPVQGH